MKKNTNAQVELTHCIGTIVAAFEAVGQHD